MPLINLLQKHRRNRVLAALLILLSGAAIPAAITFYPNTHFQNPSALFYLPAEVDAEGLVSKLSREGIIRRSSTLRLYLRFTGKSRFPAGRYLLRRGMGNRELIRLLASGRQEPVRIPMDNLRSAAELAGRVARYVQADSAAMADIFLHAPLANSPGMTPENLATLFIAEEIVCDWTAKPEDIFRHLQSRHAAFWGEEQKRRAGQMGLSPEQVYTLASIVKGETRDTSEAPIIAGLYLNRLRIGMPLQADPTVVFAGQLAGVRRVVHGDLSIDSPYNTYRYPGLPPGPISLVTPSYLNAVLHAPEVDYLYMCARPGYGNGHAFAASYEEHLENARAYHDWLDKEQIQR